ncbi:MAG: hypothetical protein M1540_08875 [Candidatus Bathyarchaeota archaeon]|nr:hypothetical protein [Candidatus Bathyarchaeota archaeon]
MSKNQSTKNTEWLHKWEQFGQRINQFPEWMQTILLEDVETAIRNRLVIFEMIHNKVKGAS